MMLQATVDLMSIHWPEVITLDANVKTQQPFMEVDENIVDFVGARGIARYYIDKVKSNEDGIFIRKFYGITF